MDFITFLARVMNIATYGWSDSKIKYHWMMRVETEKVTASNNRIINIKLV